MTTDSYVTTLVSGQLMINGKSTDEEYEISKTKTSLNYQDSLILLEFR